MPTDRSHSAPIVAGYDGTPSSRAAVHWAAAAAVRSNVPLRIVQAGGTEATALADDIALRHPELHVETQLSDAPATSVLLDEAAQARLLVLGTPGSWIDHRSGSVATHCVGQACCPVVVMGHQPQGNPASPPTVVVGADGSRASARAIEFAFDHAAETHARVVVLHAWVSPFLRYPNGAAALLFDEARITEDAQLLVSESVAGAAADHPDVPWSSLVVSGSAADWLVRLSETADLVVTGSRGHHGLAGVLLGSVSRQVLHHAHCPAAVVR